MAAGSAGRAKIIYSNGTITITETTARLAGSTYPITSITSVTVERRARPWYGISTMVLGAVVAGIMYENSPETGLLILLGSFFGGLILGFVKRRSVLIIRTARQTVALEIATEAKAMAIERALLSAMERMPRVEAYPPAPG